MERVGTETSGNWCGVYVERRSLVGEDIWSVTVSSAGTDVRQRLFSHLTAARAFAGQQVERLELPLFDIADTIL